MEKVEVILAAPPDRDDVVAQFFAKDKDQWATVAPLSDGTLTFEVYPSGGVVYTFALGDLLAALARVQEYYARPRVE